MKHYELKLVLTAEKRSHEETTVQAIWAQAAPLVCHRQYIPPHLTDTGNGRLLDLLHAL
jgi:hypothetical protein